MSRISQDRRMEFFMAAFTLKLVAKTKRTKDTTKKKNYTYFLRLQAQLPSNFTCTGIKLAISSDSRLDRSPSPDTRLLPLEKEVGVYGHSDKTMKKDTYDATTRCVVSVCVLDLFAQLMVRKCVLDPEQWGWLFRVRAWSYLGRAAASGSGHWGCRAPNPQL